MQMTLKDACQFYSGTGFPEIYQGQNTGKYPFYKVGDISVNVAAGNIYLQQCDNYVNDEVVEKIHGTVIPPGTVVFAKIGEALKKNRRALTKCNCLVDNNAMGISPQNEILRTKYFYYLMCKVKLQEYSEATAVPSVRKSKLEQITIHVPELIDQENIEQKLDTITSIIKIRQQQLTNLDTLIKARFVEMFGDVTEIVPLSYYIESLTAGKSLAGEAECQNKVLKTGAATYDYFDPAQIKNLPTDYEPLPEHQIHDGDVIISRMNTLELVGASAYVWKAPDNTYLPDRLWKAIISDKANPIFVWQSIIQPTSKEAIRKIAGGTSGSMKNISKQGLLNLHVKLVDIDQQNEFAAFVSQIDKSKAVVQAALDKAQLLFDSLMQQYFG